ncbi:hypothetical protein ABZX75_26505 [Streptomyces sp. NPDC003038]|uniref:hypothetical protein n=1 Tax=unclassified Streptomyces TaxID=2593676 RepID=UPI00339F21F8
MTAEQGRPSATPAKLVESRPWRRRDGPQPRVWCSPPGDRPALYIWSAGSWRYASTYRNGRVVYQVAFDPDGSHLIVIRSYAWPQPGLRAAHPAGSQPAASGLPNSAAERGRGGINA